MLSALFLLLRLLQRINLLRREKCSYMSRTIDIPLFQFLREDVRSQMQWISEFLTLQAAYLRRHLPLIAGIVTLAGQTSGTRDSQHLEALATRE